MASCFLLRMTDDSIDGIYETLTRCAKISKNAGGIGVHAHCIRSAGAHIAGTNGTSNGLAAMLPVYNATARYVDQGGGKRKGAFAIYLEIWHADFPDCLLLLDPNRPAQMTAHDLFFGAWICDLFMKRVEQNGVWSLMCPDQCPGLYETYGDEFEQLYLKYESEKKYVKQVQAIDLWFKLLDCQIEHGHPYVLFKDACNKKSNQKNIGPLTGSNLCT